MRNAYNNPIANSGMKARAIRKIINYGRNSSYKSSGDVHINADVFVNYFAKVADNLVNYFSVTNTEVTQFLKDVPTPYVSTYFFVDPVTPEEVYQ
ncbi:hypothetical protein JTB14_036597 [Gonioctena quinquepunctata]|nr:hypothetical protein JTB14_036597 [Gonioctena quinquepunctata]